MDPPGRVQCASSDACSGTSRVRTPDAGTATRRKTGSLCRPPSTRYVRSSAAPRRAFSLGHSPRSAGCWESGSVRRGSRRHTIRPTPATRLASPTESASHGYSSTFEVGRYSPYGIGFVLSFPNPDRRALPHQAPNLVHLLVHHRDAPLRPVAFHPHPFPQPVYHDVPAGVHSRLPRARHVRRIRVRNMQRQMILAARVPPADAVPPFRRPPVAGAWDPPAPAPARSGRSAARSPTQEQHFALFLAHHHQIHPQNAAPHHPSR